ncbi:hypothetical protein [Rhodococcoides fascians]|nr:hypothetical protein [Rhodococcus fascians]
MARRLRGAPEPRRAYRGASSGGCVHLDGAGPGLPRNRAARRKDIDEQNL